MTWVAVLLGEVGNGETWSPAPRTSSLPAAFLCTGDGPHAVDELIAAVTDESGEDPQAARAWVDDAVRTLRDLGLLGRTQPFSPPAPPGPAGEPNHPGRHIGVTHAVGVHRVAFRSDDPELVDIIDMTLGDHIDKAADEFFDAHPTDTGGVDLFAPDEWALHLHFNGWRVSNRPGINE